MPGRPEYPLRPEGQALGHWKTQVKPIWGHLRAHRRALLKSSPSSASGYTCIAVVPLKETCERLTRSSPLYMPGRPWGEKEKNTILMTFLSLKLLSAKLRLVVIQAGCCSALKNVQDAVNWLSPLWYISWHTELCSYYITWDSRGFSTVLRMTTLIWN